MSLFLKHSISKSWLVRAVHGVSCASHQSCRRPGQNWEACLYAFFFRVIPDQMHGFHTLLYSTNWFNHRGALIEITESNHNPAENLGSWLLRGEFRRLEMWDTLRGMGFKPSILVHIQNLQPATKYTFMFSSGAIPGGRDIVSERKFKSFATPK